MGWQPDALGPFTRELHCRACDRVPARHDGLRPMPPLCPDCGGELHSTTGRWQLRRVRGWFRTRIERVRFVPKAPPATTTITVSGNIACDPQAFTDTLQDLLTHGSLRFQPKNEQ